jgi:hypothetical protein
MKHTLKTQIGSYAVAAVLAISAAATAYAQVEPETVLPPTVEGSWVRTDTNGSGNFGNLTSAFKPAELTEKGKQLANAGNRPQQRPEVRSATGAIVTNPTPCIYNGGQLGLEYDSEGFIAVKSKDEIVFVQDRGADRHVYLNKKEMPDPALRAPTGSGYSIGHIEPDGTLVVETSDMTPGRVTAGGYRTPKTVVEQRYIPDPDGKHLKLVITWKDPEIYVTPHTYTYTFERVPKGSNSLDEFCDATNPLEGQSVVAPVDSK